MSKYFEDNKHRVNIKKDVIHESSFSIQLKENK